MSLNFTLEWGICYSVYLLSLTPDGSTSKNGKYANFACFFTLLQFLSIFKWDFIMDYDLWFDTVTNNAFLMYYPALLLININYNNKLIINGADATFPDFE